MTTPLSVIGPSSDAAIHWQARLDLLDGDLVFRTGRDLMARIVLSQGITPRFSHVGLIVMVEGGPFVVHAIPREGHSPGGVILEPLGRFVAPANAADTGFYRIKTATSSSRAKLREYALKQIGKPFDGAFSLADDSQMYCTELVVKAVAAGGIDIAATAPPIRVMLLAEPVVLPDQLRLSPLVEPLTPNITFDPTDVLPRPSGSVGRRGST